MDTLKNETGINIWDYPSDAEIERAEAEYLRQQEIAKRRAAFDAFIATITLRRFRTANTRKSATVWR